ncbi:hypothetical protein QSJ18_19200 [Gordonia sp. ABSL1-1]|uniref:hypothetical protein n=1 Tax=Gordonia sp. ABSL1-1 TaxID=3053923 RepID=UPI00257374FC|nr:hypothetical protein [Gordonia sp. ABSL1-1]MDL9938879.1 hypothetical protein [Gordonia sp. ABSL1-1]
MATDDLSPAPSTLDIVRRFGDDGGDLIALCGLARARAAGSPALSGPGSAVALVWGEGDDEAGLLRLAEAARHEASVRAAAEAEAACDEPLG